MNFQNLAKHSTNYTIDDDELSTNNKNEDTTEKINEKGLFKF